MALTKIDVNMITGSYGGKAITAIVDFGFPAGQEGDIARVTVAAPWVLSSTILVCSIAAVSTPDHDPEDAVAEGIVAYVANIVNGVSFDIEAVAPQNTWGKYQVNIIGV